MIAANDLDLSVVVPVVLFLSSILVSAIFGIAKMLLEVSRTNERTTARLDAVDKRHNELDERVRYLERIRTGGLG